MKSGDFAKVWHQKGVDKIESIHTNHYDFKNWTKNTYGPEGRIERMRRPLCRNKAVTNSSNMVQRA